MRTLPRILSCAVLVWGVVMPLVGGEFVVASYNLKNYVGTNAHKRPVKSAAAKSKVAEMIVRVRPDVLALQEMGEPVLLEELRQALKARGLEYPHSHWVAGADPAIHLAVLSRFQFATSQVHDQVAYLLDGRRLLVSRGFGEVQVQVNERYRFVLFNAHLKSKRPVLHADQAEMRLAEARALRAIIDRRLAEHPQINLLALGDFNDTKDAPPIKALIGRTGLIDLRPVEKLGGQFSTQVAWTWFYAREDSYSRLDYLLVNAGMARERIAQGTYVLAAPDWYEASDHRPVVATFADADR
ncbi:MAG: endonuclease/exonuclease/phosphatase family protein [Pedosphaera sp.]|nr:endonuclease/exonuclease/phosphatase family protein [Pedosphaera sp.]